MTRLALIAAPLLLAACVTPALTEDAIDRGEWALVGIGGQDVDWGVTLAFAGDGFSGQAPCNRYFGQTGAALPALAIDSIGATRMACPDLDREQAWFETLKSVQRAEMDQGHLFLIGPEGLVVEFVRDPAKDPCLSCLAAQ